MSKNIELYEPSLQIIELNSPLHPVNQNESTDFDPILNHLQNEKIKNLSQDQIRQWLPQKNTAHKLLDLLVEIPPSHQPFRMKPQKTVQPKACSGSFEKGIDQDKN